MINHKHQHQQTVGRYTSFLSVNHMENRFNFLDWLSIVLLIVGGLNWGMVGFFDVDVVASIFGVASTASRIVYALVGLAALYAIATSAKAGRIQTSLHQLNPNT